MGQLGEQLQIAQDQRRLGDDADRGVSVAQRFQATTGEPVAPLAGLVGIRCRPDRHPLSRPGLPAQLLP